MFHARPSVSGLLPPPGGPDATVVTLTRPLSPERLSARACVLCGSTEGPLVPAGLARVVPPVGTARSVSRPVVTCQLCTQGDGGCGT
jgi:hypothetical protein